MCYLASEKAVWSVFKTIIVSLLFFPKIVGVQLTTVRLILVIHRLSEIFPPHLQRLAKFQRALLSQQLTYVDWSVKTCHISKCNSLMHVHKYSVWIWG